MRKMVYLFLCVAVLSAGCAHIPKRVTTRPSVISTAPSVKDIGAYDAEVLRLSDKGKVPQTLRCLWRVEGLSNQIRPVPAADRTALYLNVGGLWALDLNSGKTLWRYSGQYGGGSNISSSPHIAGDLLIAGSNSYAVLAFDRKTGEVPWIYRTGGWVQAPVHIDAKSNKLFVGAWDKKFHALDITTGKGLWSFPTHSYVGEEACAQGKYVYFSDANSLVCLRAEDGRLVSKYQFPEVLVSGPIAMEDGSMLIWCANGILYEMALTEGDEDKAPELHEQRTLRICAERRSVQEGFPHSKHCWFGHRLVLTDDTGVLVCVDTEEWKRLWSFDQLSFQELPCDFCPYGKNQLLVSLRKGRVVAYDIKTGRHIWEATLPGIANPQVIYARKRLFAIGRRDGSVTGYQIR